MGLMRKGWAQIVLGVALLGLTLLGLGCKDIVEAPTALTYATNPAVYVAGTAITANAPAHTGGDVDSYAVSPTLPTGLSLAAKTGIISGTPTAVTAVATYTVTATNSAGSTTASLSITVEGPPLSITTQPADQSILVGATATFSVVASGTGTLTYQWLLNDVAITGATSASYTTAAAVIADSGAAFTVRVSDSFGGTVTSSAATLTVQTPLTITTQPASQSILEGATATFTVAATGTGTLTYQWRRNGTAITGATSASYTTPATALSDTGAVFSVVVSDGIGGSVTSANATLTVRASVAAGLFTFTGSLAGGRYFHTATLLNDGTVLVAGGYLTSPVSTLELYDPATGTFSSAGVLATPRYGHTATLLPDGTVLIAGGITFGAAATATAEIYDPATGNLAVAPSLTHARAYHTATRLANGQVLLAAGRDSLAVLQTAELYDPVGLASTATAGAPMAFRYQHTATLLANGKVLLAGGYGSSLLASAELYDPTTGTFALTGSMSTGRYWHTATALGNGKVLVAGGTTALAVELYDPTTGSFSAGSTLSTIRFSHTATLLPSGSVLLAAGKNSDPSASGTLLNSAELFDPTTGLITSAGSMGQGRYNHTATLVSGKVLLAGGLGPSFSTAELYF